MKKIHKILLVFVLLVVAVAVSVISNLPIAKTQEAVGEVLRKKLDLPQDAVITCAGDYTVDEYALLWFTAPDQYMTLYRAVDCRVLNNGSYLVKKIYTPAHTRGISCTLYGGMHAILFSSTIPTAGRLCVIPLMARRKRNFRLKIFRMFFHMHRRMAQQAAIFWTLSETASDN